MTDAPSPAPPLIRLAELADRADAELHWPDASWDVLRQTDALRWVIPGAFGGEGLRGLALYDRYQALAGACLTTCFLLSQRDAACRRLRDGDNAELAQTLLPALARGERFITVGLSQLTTSRQHVAPTFRAWHEGDDFLLDGAIPWVTGAAHAHDLLVGATLDDGRQVLFVLPTDLPGVRVGPPLELAALRGSLTAEVHCERVRLPARQLLAGPAERVLQAGRGGPGGLETSALALGLTDAALTHLEREAGPRPSLEPTAERLRRKWRHSRTELERLASGAGTAEEAALLRGRANLLALQASQAALTASKGTGFVRPHPAQRWARQALFFLVWSCPWPAASATLEQLAAIGVPQCP